MKTKAIVSAALLAAFLSATTGGIVYARQSAEADNDAVTDLAQAQISLAQAVGQAETHAGGKATRAELDHEHGVLAFEVEVITAQSQVFDVQVDARNGKVLASKMDAADDLDLGHEEEQDNDHDKTHEDGETRRK